MRSSYALIPYLGILMLTSCVSIPKEAPELSQELGAKMKTIQDSHFLLIEKFFDQKRRDIDDFIEETWIPAFAEQLFELQDIQEAWEYTVNSGEDYDRVQFIRILGPRLITQINEKRQELITPLNALEKDLKDHIQNEYDTAYSINNTLTSFLYSAAEVAENRSRYLEHLGLTDDKMDTALDQTSTIVDQLVSYAGTADESIEKIDAYKRKLNEILEKLQ